MHCPLLNASQSTVKLHFASLGLLPNHFVNIFLSLNSFSNVGNACISALFSSNVSGQSPYNISLFLLSNRITFNP